MVIIIKNKTEILFKKSIKIVLYKGFIYTNRLNNNYILSVPECNQS
jgi:hypothetical protein